MKNTKHIEGRRTLRFNTLSEALADIEALVSAGPVKSLGNWSVAQNIDHVAMGIEFGFKGFPAGFKAPLPLKLFGPMLRPLILKRPITPGFKPPANVMKHFLPGEQVTLERAMGRVRSAVATFNAGPTVPRHALFGKMNKQQWEQLNCRHAELHFGFLVPA